MGVREGGTKLVIRGHSLFHPLVDQFDYVPHSLLVEPKGTVHGGARQEARVAAPLNAGHCSRVVVEGHHVVEVLASKNTKLKR